MPNSTGESISDDGEQETSKFSQIKSPKPLPPGYICKICGAANDHAIYNCPLHVPDPTKKKRKKATEQDESIKEDGTPGNTIIFLSGLPFDTTRQSLQQLLTDEGIKESSIQDIKVIPFSDNSKKCKGISYVTLNSKQDIEICLQMNGKNIKDLKLVAEINDKRIKRLNNKKKRDPNEIKSCYRCGLKHDPKTCTNPRICYKCKSTEHLSSACPKKKKF